VKKIDLLAEGSRYMDLQANSNLGASSSDPDHSREAHGGQEEGTQAEEKLQASRPKPR